MKVLKGFDLKLGQGRRQTNGNDAAAAATGCRKKKN